MDFPQRTKHTIHISIFLKSNFAVYPVVFMNSLLPLERKISIFFQLMRFKRMCIFRLANIKFRILKMKVKIFKFGVANRKVLGFFVSNWELPDRSYWKTYIHGVFINQGNTTFMWQNSCPFPIVSYFFL